MSKPERCPECGAPATSEEYTDTFPGTNKSVQVVEYTAIDVLPELLRAWDFLTDEEPPWSPTLSLTLGEIEAALAKLGYPDRASIEAAIQEMGK